MQRCLVLILSIFMVTNLLANDVRLARNNFSKVTTLREIDKVLSLIEGINTPVSNAYKGAYTMLKAKCVNSPFKKYACFNQGKIWIEKAIEENPNHIEIRYIRAMLQANLPKFLNYSGNISDDIDFVLKNFNSAKISKEVKYKIITNLVAANLITDEQKVTIFYQINYERKTSSISR